MIKKKQIVINLFTGILLLCFFQACKMPAVISRQENSFLPGAYDQSRDTLNSGMIQWRTYFTDADLVALIDTALKNNQELNIVLQEIEISKNEIMARKAEYLPFVNMGGAAGIEKEGRYTRHGAVDEAVEMKPAKPIPKVLPDFRIGAYASWELDVWRKLRNAKKAAVMRYLSSVEGKNFMVTNLIAEIASSYYELTGLDNLLDIVQRNIEIQTNALQVIKMEKDAAKVSQLAVNRFEAQLLNTKNLQYEIRQKIVETENRLNFLVGRFPGPVRRNAALFSTSMTDTVFAGIPSQLLLNRPDIRQAEWELAAAKLDAQVAKANFYPSFRLTAGVGLQAFNPVYLVNPESILYNLAGDLVAPLINKNAIKATYINANAKQVQAVYNYERTILNAHIEVVNRLSQIDNYTKSYATKSEEADILTRSVSISNNLFRSARADYVEVLLTQREALEARIDLIEIKLKQLEAKINIYKALGGGWK
jgi:multidrug efflux system outer membrane protein